ncbi:hypothetical protein FHX42_005269 [Saccharopolyspora lacisalsi]|uniref:AAA domain-containing protein n=1 Tax=Halosaccharopolyspora lacisalsi TaxID=1000566 RepID=A0A839E0Y9_9PSEU|nr:AAA family ATPase [Halosaccharopolyspora lacisalsi]MBA8827862.1 hypothetical protein [Halosaccharopolyspora lacisalsi]
MAFADQIANRPTPTLKLADPDGTPRFPVIVVAGEPGSGKSHTAAANTGDSRIGRSYWIELGVNNEGIGREYSQVPGSDYKLIDHNGSFEDLFGQLLAVREQAEHDLNTTGKPSLLIIDDVSGLWEQIKAWTYHRAENSKAGRKTLEEDPDAAVDVGRNLWNDARSRYAQFMAQIVSFPGPVVLLAQAKEVSGTDDNGRPTKVTEWKIECHESLPSYATAIVRLDVGKPARLTKLRSPVPGQNINTSDQPVNLGTLDTANVAFDYLKADRAVIRRLRTNGVNVDALPDTPVDQRWEDALAQVLSGEMAHRGTDLLASAAKKFVRDDGSEHEFVARVRDAVEGNKQPATTPTESDSAPEYPPRNSLSSPMVEHSAPEQSGADDTAGQIHATMVASEQTDHDTGDESGDDTQSDADAYRAALNAINTNDPDQLTAAREIRDNLQDATSMDELARIRLFNRADKMVTAMTPAESSTT